MSTADETVTCFHSFHATARITEAESEQVAIAGGLRRTMLVSYGLENWCPFWCPFRTPVS